MKPIIKMDPRTSLRCSVRTVNAPERVACQAIRKVKVPKTTAISSVSKPKKIQLSITQDRHRVVAREDDARIVVIPITGLPSVKNKSCRLLSNISFAQSNVQLTIVL